MPAAVETNTNFSPITFAVPPPPLVSPPQPAMISTKAAFARHERKRRSTPRLTDLLFHSIPIPPLFLSSLEELPPFSPWREASSALLAAFCRDTRGVASKLHFPRPSSVSGEGSVLRNL